MTTADSFLKKRDDEKALTRNRIRWICTNKKEKEDR